MEGLRKPWFIRSCQARRLFFPLHARQVFGSAAQGQAFFHYLRPRAIFRNESGGFCAQALPRFIEGGPPREVVRRNGLCSTRQTRGQNFKLRQKGRKNRCPRAEPALGFARSFGNEAYAPVILRVFGPPALRENSRPTSRA